MVLLWVSFVTRSWRPLLFIVRALQARQFTLSAPIKHDANWKNARYERLFTIKRSTSSMEFDSMA